MITFDCLRLPEEVAGGLKQGVLLAVASLVLVLPPGGAASASRGDTRVTPVISTGLPLHPSLPERTARFGDHAATAEARRVADWVADSRDSRGLPFVVLDKRDARVFVFAEDGDLIGTSPVLLGAAPGDDSVEGIGDRPIAEVRPEERTTPAGRFVSQPGKNANGEDVVWVDHGAAVSMHRVRPIDPRERRLERLASPDPAERRISYGCINVPVAFFESVVWPTLGASRAVVYVLPEIKDIRAVFAAAYAPQRSAAAVHVQTATR